MKKWLRSVAIGGAAMMLAALGLQASDLLTGVDGRLASLVSTSEDGWCEAGMTPLFLGERAICIDIYENAPVDECPHTTVASFADTTNNLNNTACIAVSEAGATPWSYVSFTQAQQLCARSGKRLPTNEEWYAAVSGSVTNEDCVTDGSGAQITGTGSCSSPAGVHDLIGNVWEWVDASVVDGVIGDVVLPETGYVTAVDRVGIVTATSDQPDAAYGEDYAITKADGSYAAIRGGFYGSGEDAGIFAQNLAAPTDLRTAGIGFRCVKDIPVR